MIGEHSHILWRDDKIDQYLTNNTKFSTNDFYEVLFGTHRILSRISNSVVNDFDKF